MELVQQLYETIRNHKKEDGSLLCDAFIRVPKRRQEPGYYEVCVKLTYLKYIISVWFVLTGF